MIDLPRLEAGASFESTVFSQELFRFLRALSLDERLIRSLENYDFAETRQYGFVHTMYWSPLLMVIGDRSNDVANPGVAFFSVADPTQAMIGSIPVRHVRAQFLVIMR